MENSFVEQRINNRGLARKTNHQQLTYVDVSHKGVGEGLGGVILNLELGGRGLEKGRSDNDRLEHFDTLEINQKVVSNSGCSGSSLAASTRSKWQTSRCEGVLYQK